MARWLAPLALAALAISAQGCGGASPPEPAPTPAAATVTPEPTPTPEPSPTPTPSPTPSALQRLDDGGYRGLITVKGTRLTAAAWRDRDRMYVTDHHTGAIRLVNVETGDIDVVHEGLGLTIPQGLTVLHGRLYVTDMGNVCAVLEAAFGVCGSDYRKMQKDELLGLVSATGARLLSYRIDDSGNLSDERIVLDNVVSIQRDHSANGLANDGEYVYVSIGH